MYHFEHLDFLLFWIYSRNSGANCSHFLKLLYKCMYTCVNVCASMKTCDCRHQPQQTAWAHDAGKVQRGEQKHPLTTAARWNKGSATMRRSNGNTQHNGSHPWESSQCDSSEWPRRTSTMINSEGLPPTVSNCLLYVKGKQRKKLQGFSLTMSLRVVKALHAETLVWPSLASHSDVEESVTLIVQASLRASSDFQTFRINTVTLETRNLLCSLPKSTSADVRLRQGLRSFSDQTWRQDARLAFRTNTVSSYGNENCSRSQNQKKHIFFCVILYFFLATDTQ